MEGTMQSLIKSDFGNRYLCTLLLYIQLSWYFAGITVISEQKLSLYINYDNSSSIKKYRESLNSIIILTIIIIIESSRGSFAQPSYGVQAQHRSYLLIGQELVFEHEYAVGVRHMR